METVFADKDVVLTAAQQFGWSGLPRAVGEVSQVTCTRTTAPLCRTGQADPDTFGIFDMHGLWFVRGNFVRDVASLNKMELLPWDGWGIIEGKDEDLSPEDLAFLDQVAKLTDRDVPEFERVCTLYEKDNRLPVPATIRSYTQMGVQTVDLAYVVPRGKAE